MKIHFDQWKKNRMIDEFQLEEPQKSFAIALRHIATVDNENGKIINWQKHKLTFTFSQSFVSFDAIRLFVLSFVVDPSGRMPWMAFGVFACGKETKKNGNSIDDAYSHVKWGCFQHFCKDTDTNNCLVKSPIAQQHQHNGFYSRFFAL